MHGTFGFRNGRHFGSWLVSKAPDHVKGELEDALDGAQKAGVNWLQILMTLLPLILSLFSGGTVDWQAVIAAILELFQK